MISNTKNLCGAMTKSGERCRNKVNNPSLYCYKHRDQYVPKSLGGFESSPLTLSALPCEIACLITMNAPDSGSYRKWMLVSKAFSFLTANQKKAMKEKFIYTLFTVQYTVPNTETEGVLLLNEYIKCNTNSLFYYRCFDTFREVCKPEKDRVYKRISICPMVNAKKHGMEFEYRINNSNMTVAGCVRFTNYNRGKKHGQELKYSSLPCPNTKSDDIRAGKIYKKLSWKQGKKTGVSNFFEIFGNSSQHKRSPIYTLPDPKLVDPDLSVLYPPVPPEK